MIPSLEAIEAIHTRRGDAVVVSTLVPLREWSSVSRRRELDMDLSDSRDKAPSLRLGIALAQPSRKVLVLDCDAALRTNLGSLATVGKAAPKNLVNFLFEDGDYISTDGKPIPGLDGLNYRSLAEAAGYPRAYEFDNLEDFVISLQEVIEAAGPSFVSLKVVYGRNMSDYPARTARESFEAVNQALEKFPAEPGQR